MNRYFDWPASLKRLLRGDTARAEDVNDALDQLSAGLDVVQVDIDRSIKAPPGESLDLNIPAAQRANKVLAFDNIGSPIVIGAGWNWRGDWMTATGYAPADMFRDLVTKDIYAVVQSHTSTSIAADLSAGKISLAINLVDVETAKNTAVGAATTATNAASSASSSASNAQASEQLAEDWAKKLGGAVDGTEYSAKKYAQDAQAAADAAQGSVTAPVAYAIHSADPKIVPSANDEFALVDSSGGWPLKKVTLAQLASNLTILPASMSITYSSGRVVKITEDGVETNITYNPDETVNTISYPHNGKTRTETYTYTDGWPTGMTASEV